MVEAYSPPRVTLEARKFGLKLGEAWDLTNGWDFNRENHRRKAKEYIDKEEPLVHIGNPPCTAFSQLQSLNPTTEKSKQQRHLQALHPLHQEVSHLLPGHSDQHQEDDETFEEAHIIKVKENGVVVLEDDVTRGSPVSARMGRSCSLTLWAVGIKLSISGFRKAPAKRASSACGPSGATPRASKPT